MPAARPVGLAAEAESTPCPTQPPGPPERPCWSPPVRPLLWTPTRYNAHAMKSAVIVVLVIASAVVGVLAYARRTSRTTQMEQLSAPPQWKSASEIRRERDELKRRYRVAYQRLNDILFSEDPIGINFKENTDEYEPEVGTILPRLRDCRSKDDVERVVHEEFVRWFDVQTAGPRAKYQKIAQRVWDEVMPHLPK